MAPPIPIALLEGEIRLSKFGVWSHDGADFSHPGLIDLFHRSIAWDEAAQRYRLAVGAFRADFVCEDSAYFVKRLDDRAVPWRVMYADGRWEPLDPLTLELGREQQIYCRRTDGHRARFSRAAHQIAVAHAVDERHLKIGETSFELKGPEGSCPGRAEKK